jgi:hypothetical protein
MSPNFLENLTGLVPPKDLDDVSKVVGLKVSRQQ